MWLTTRSATATVNHMVDSSGAVVTATPRQPGPTPAGRQRLRRLTLAAGLLLVVQIALGTVVNLYVTVPAHHPGAHPANYFAGSVRSVAWALGDGVPALAVHAAVGLLLFLVAAALAVGSVAARAGWSAVTSVLAALLVLGAAFNGASFLDFGHASSSLLMALLALAALACYLVGGHLLTSGSAGS